MGLCYSRNISSVKDDEIPVEQPSQTPRRGSIPQSPIPSEVNSYASSPFQSPLPAGVAPSPARTPGRKFKWPFPPPSPAKPIMAALRRRRGAPPRPRDEPIPEDSEDVDSVGGERLDKNFGFGKNVEGKYELGKEVGRGHFGHTCWAKAKKGKMKGQTVAVKIISKAKMTSALSIEDVRREVKLLKALSGHKHMVKFYDVYEDNDNVYVVMELCEGGELLDRILARGGRYPEVDAKRILVQILSATAFFHLQGVVHRDLKPENFLFTSRNEDAVLKVIDFGLSDFIRYDQRLNDVVGSAYYVAPEVLHRSYSTEADMWSIGVISYILLCGSRPFYGRTESAIFRCVLRANPNFEDMPWPSISPTGKDFVKRLLNKDHRKRMTAAQALAHPWLRDENPGLLLDFSVYKLVRSYIRASPFRRSALKALAKAIPDEELVFLKAQFMLLDPKDGGLSLNSFTTALTRYATDAMMESKLPDILNTMQPLVQKKLDFEEFCAAGVSVYQLEALEEWEQIATSAFEQFEQEGNRVISVQELAGEMSVGPNAYPLLKDWIRSSDGKLSFLGYAKFLHGVTVRSSSSRPSNVSEGARSAVSLSGTLFGSYPIKVRLSKTAIAPVDPSLLPKSQDEREKCAKTVYCTNIDKKVTQMELEDFFKTACGEIQHVRLIGYCNHQTFIAFVEFKRVESAVSALNCSGIVLGGLPLWLCWIESWPEVVKYPEVDAKRILVQILSATAFFHLQGVVHRDLKPEISIKCSKQMCFPELLFTSRNEDAVLKVIDFGLSDFIRYDRRLNVLDLSVEELNLQSSFRCVLRANPNFEDLPWPSPTGKDFVKRLLNKDHRKRMTAAQALGYFFLKWKQEHYKSYIRASPFRRSALKALSKAIPDEELVFLKAQFMLLDPKDGGLSLNSFTTAMEQDVKQTSLETRAGLLSSTLAPLHACKTHPIMISAITIHTFPAILSL
ncbi:hypothetical protein DY000_02011370 [Brassica cretica]|uniref:non-specific serine/threonine protein kinase n=1 Tax=Brassica cretica TaxID=69181 RepID=A0ABQ7D1L6_BRACR|nr:hypothetical protein DY000_02011370 [Brassica cretica]